MREFCPRLTLITNRYKSGKSICDYLEVVEACVAAGVDAVQLREKSLNAEGLFAFGSALKKLLKRYSNTLLIVNDCLELCLELDADGLHLGQGDGDVKKARNLLGNVKIIGVSVNTLEELRIANELPVNYIGVGAIFATRTKPDVQTIWGLSGLRQAVLYSKHPIIAVGGVDARNASAVIETGASGIAAVAAFHDHSDPGAVASALWNVTHLQKNTIEE